MEVEVMASEEATSSQRHTAAARAFRKRNKVGEQSPGAAVAADFAGKKPKVESIPDDFLECLPSTPENGNRSGEVGTSVYQGKACRQFWKAGDYEGSSERTTPAGMDHVRVHPKFLHSNATSHKWVLGAVAELLDNALDEVHHGASFINIEVLKNPLDESPMILFEDNGGGMTQNRLRECMSFGYSEKSKSANTIGQYGNGFKTSTMRLGADVIVFSKSRGKDGGKATVSVGMLSYSFLVETGQQDIMVPMLDYEDNGGLTRVLRSTEEVWNKNVKTITRWSPYPSEETLRNQFKKIKGQGTRILIYNLWEDDQKQLELDFETDPYDIQVRGAREMSNVGYAEQYTSAKHYYLYKHSLRIYASILYLKLPKGFRIVLRGKEIEHHNAASDLIHIQELTYKPQGGTDALPGGDLCAVVTLGFVRDAKQHIDVQGFNVYHKNRLIKPFWRIWNSASSQGRGVVGVLEANFVEPAHDKQGFEKTTVLQRLEARLQMMQKKYWLENSYLVGYQGQPASKRKSTAREDEALYRPSKYSSGTKAGRSTRKAAKESSPSLTSEESEEEIEVEEELPRKRKSPFRRDEDEQGKSPKSPVRKARSVPLRKTTTPARNEAPEVDNAQAAEASGKATPTPLSKAFKTPEPAKKSAPPESAKKSAPAEQPKKSAPSPIELLARKSTPTPAPAPIEASARKSTPAPVELLAKRSAPAEASVAKQASGRAMVVEQEPDLERMQEIAATNDILTSRLDKLEESDAAKLQAEISKRLHVESELESAIARGQELEKEISRMEDELQAVQVGLLKERDALKAALDEERNQREIDDVEIRRQLKSALQRVRELEAEVKVLKSGSNDNDA